MVWVQCCMDLNMVSNHGNHIWFGCAARLAGHSTAMACIAA